MSYNVLSVAKYVLSEKSMTHLRLQKTLYFLQAGFLMIKGETLFEGNIEAWTHGPVVPDVYREYRYSGNRELSFDESDREMEMGMAELFGQNEVFEDLKELESDEESIELIKEIMTNLKSVTTWELVNLTHQYETWKNHHETDKTVIPVEEIENYHLKLRGFNV